MPENWWLFFVVGLIPIIVGYVWYGPLFGKKWMSVNGFTPASLEGGNMPLILGLSFLFGSFIAAMLSGMVIHQGHIFQVMMPEVAESGSAVQQQFNDLMAQYGGRFRDFNHGVVHGAFVGVLFTFPMIAINALFERRGWAYILIHAGYWLVCMMLMGGVLCAFLTYGTAA